MYTLKTPAITGKLVPARGQHLEYETLDAARRDAEVIHDVFGARVVVVDGFDKVVAEVV